MNISEILLAGPVMPVIVIDDADLAVPLGEALLSGGINSIEVTLRTDAALDSIERLAKGLPEICVGAGTILTEINARSAANAGARFAVSPGTTRLIIDACKAHNLPLLPGASTVSEMLTLHEAGFTAMKFFPAAAAGGAPNDPCSAAAAWNKLSLLETYFIIFLRIPAPSTAKEQTT